MRKLQLAQPSAMRCDVVAPSLIPRKAGEKVKTDRRDAMMLTQTLRAGQLTEVWVPDQAHEAMRYLVSFRSQAMRDLRKTRQHLLSSLLHHERLSPYGHWTKMPMTKASQMPLYVVSTRTCLVAGMQLPTTLGQLLAELPQRFWCVLNRAVKPNLRSRHALYRRNRDRLLVDVQLQKQRMLHHGPPPVSGDRLGLRATPVALLTPSLATSRRATSTRSPPQRT